MLRECPEQKDTDPKSINNDGPKPPRRAQKAMILCIIDIYTHTYVYVFTHVCIHTYVYCWEVFWDKLRGRRPGEVDDGGREASRRTGEEGNGSGGTSLRECGRTHICAMVRTLKKGILQGS